MKTSTAPELERTPTEQLIARYHERGDRAAREVVVERHRRLAVRIANRYSRSGEPLEDLVQVALIGLLKAIDRFDPAQGRPLAAYAGVTIAGELKRHFRDRAWAVRVPRDLQERTLALKRVTDELSARTGHSPTPREAAAELGWPVEQVLEASEAAEAYETLRLDAPPTDENSDMTLADAIGSEDPGYRFVEDLDALGTAFAELTPRERTVLQLRAGPGLTQSAIGQRLNISQIQVSRLQRRADERLTQAAALDGHAAA
jgi:RNA polymerase sigma-B factor